MNDPKKMLQEANGYLRNAQNNMFSGKNEQAVELLNKADELAMGLSRQMPDDFQTNSLQQKIEKMRKDLERKGVATRPGNNRELPFEVNAQLNRIREHLVRKELHYARKELEIYYAKFAGQYTDIHQLNEINENIIRLQDEIAEADRAQAELKMALAEEDARNQELCEIWEVKLKAIPFFDGKPHNVTGLMQQKIYYQQAKELMTEFEKLVFPIRICISLESIARDLQSRIIAFPFNFQQTSRSLAEEVTRSIEERIEFFNRDVAWVNDPSQKPHLIGKNEMTEFSRRIEELRPLFQEDPSQMDALLNAMGQLSEMDDKRRIERSKLTVMKPEALSGAEADEAIKAATDALRRKYPEANIYQSAVVKIWENKRIEEWADSTKTQWIVKNVRETTVQISAAVSDGSCHLFTLHAERNIHPDGSYGSIHSHIMYEEMMANPAMA